MVSIVPTQKNYPWYTFQIALTDVIFNLTMRFNSRMDRWILDIQDASNNPILMGLPVLIDRSINGFYTIQGQPSGFFFAIDDSKKGLEPTFDSFEIDHTLLYGDDT